MNLFDKLCYSKKLPTYSELFNCNRTGTYVQGNYVNLICGCVLQNSIALMDNLLNEISRREELHKHYIRILSKTEIILFHRRLKYLSTYILDMQAYKGLCHIQII